MPSSEYANPLADMLLDHNEILSRVDEYSLYCFYLGYEPVPHTGRYRSPIRTDDDNPSFGIFYTTKNPNREFLWKDQATGEVGDIFRLVQRMFSYRTISEARLRIIHDLGLEEHSEVVKQPLIYHQVPKSFISDIRITSRPYTQPELKYWSDINIDTQVLENYFATAVKYYWLASEQCVPYHGFEHTYAYRIWSKYQIYRPFAERENKFRNNFTEQHILGLIQLKYQSPLLIITKSMKDVMFLNTLGYEAIAARSENTPILRDILALLEDRYPRIVTLFDNDGKHRADYYPNYPELHVPLSFNGKDPTDVARNHSVRTAATMLTDILNPYL
jgi:hypothetical protein